MMQPSKYSTQFQMIIFTTEFYTILNVSVSTFLFRLLIMLSFSLPKSDLII